MLSGSRFKVGTCKTTLLLCVLQCRQKESLGLGTKGLFWIHINAYSYTQHTKPYLQASVGLPYLITEAWLKAPGGTTKPGQPQGALGGNSQPIAGRAGRIRVAIHPQ